MSGYIDKTVLAPFVHLATNSEWGPHVLIDLVAGVINVWLLLAAISLSDRLFCKDELRESSPILAMIVDKPARLTRYLLVLWRGNDVPTWAPAVVTFALAVFASVLLTTIAEEMRATAP